MYTEIRNEINPNINFCDGCKYYKSEIAREFLPPYQYRKTEYCKRFDCSITYKRRCVECLESYIKEGVIDND